MQPEKTTLKIEREKQTYKFIEQNIVNDFPEIEMLEPGVFEDYSIK
jgi:hypothetical protein